MTGAAWIEVGTVDEIPRRGARVVETQAADIAVFRTATDEVFALEDRCPHKGGPLSQGIVHGRRVTCPLHDWVIGLLDGQAQGADVGCSRVVAVRLEGRRILLNIAALARRAA